MAAAIVEYILDHSGETWTNLRVFGCVVKVPHWRNHEMISHWQNHAMMTKTTLTSKLVLPFLFYIYLEALTRRKEMKSFVLFYSVINAQYSLSRLALLCLSSAQWVCRKSRAARSGSPSPHLSSQQSQPPLTLAPSSHLFLVY